MQQSIFSAFTQYNRGTIGSQAPAAPQHQQQPPGSPAFSQANRESDHSANANNLKQVVPSTATPASQNIGAGRLSNTRSMLSNNMRSVITEVIDEENEKLLKSNLSSTIEASPEAVVSKGGVQMIDPNYGLKAETK